MFINGQWLTGSSTFPSLNPATTEVIDQVTCATQGNVEDAVSAARSALGAWQALGVAGRANAMTGALEALQAAYGDEGSTTPLKDLITREVGKRLPEADIEVAESADMLEYFISEAQALLASETLALDQTLWPNKASTVIYEPVGVVGIIKPWNYPLEIPMWSLAPALLAGNTVVFKPSEDSSLVGAELVRIISASVPAGVLNMVTGPAEVGRMLVNANVDMISFTGSAAAGAEIASLCGTKMRRCTMELGGNDAALILADADIELTANGLTWGCFCNSGQVCVRPKRVFVHESIADALIEAVIRKTNGLRKDIDFGPLINRAQLEAVQDQVTEAEKAGAKILCGGSRLGLDGYYFAPTIMTDVDCSEGLMQDECFGPVMPIVTYATENDAVRQANESAYGLGGSVWTSDLARGRQVAEALECGMVWVNDVNVAFPQAPWGGRKISGIGAELGKWGLHEYVIPKHINIDTSDEQRRAWWYPY